LLKAALQLGIRLDGNGLGHGGQGARWGADRIGGGRAWPARRGCCWNSGLRSDLLGASASCRNLRKPFVRESPRLTCQLIQQRVHVHDEKATAIGNQMVTSLKKRVVFQIWSAYLGVT
jgi:hypothetical protein